MQSPPAYLWMPFFGAILFAASSLTYKQAFSRGARVSQAFLANNLTLMLLFMPLAWVESKPIPWRMSWHPVVAGTCFFAANVLNFRALRAGDVSLVTPLMGTKVLFVALFARLILGASVGAAQMVAALMTTVGIFLLGFTEVRGGRWIGPATGYALASSATFALCDIFMQRWAADFGAFRFLPLMFLWVGMVSALMVLGTGGLKGADWSGCGRWVLLGAVLMGFQALLIASSISLFRDATGVNIVYSLRGLWGIAIVWMLGERVASLETAARHPWVLWMRGIGAVLILAAVILAIQSTRWEQSGSAGGNRTGVKTLESGGVR